MCVCMCIKHFHHMTKLKTKNDVFSVHLMRLHACVYFVCPSVRWCASSLCSHHKPTQHQLSCIAISNEMSLIYMHVHTCNFYGECGLQTVAESWVNLLHTVQRFSIQHSMKIKFFCTSHTLSQVWNLEFSHSCQI